MKKMYSIFVALVCAVLVLALMVNAASGYTVAPFSFNALGLWIFDPALNGPAAHGQWVKDADNNWVLSLAKNVPTSEVASAGAQINGVKGITLDELGFDYKNGEYCGAGAARFNVRTSDGKLFFFGCASGTQTVGADWTKVEFEDSDAFPQDGVSSWPGFGDEDAVIDSISIVFDEEGSVLLDNIVVNDISVGGPGNTK